MAEKTRRSRRGRWTIGHGGEEEGRGHGAGGGGGDGVGLERGII